MIVFLDRLIMAKRLLFLLLLFVGNSLFSQDIWEELAPHSSPWTVSENLKTLYNVHGLTQFRNENAPSDDNIKNNTWNSEGISIKCEEECPYAVSFSIENLTSPTVAYNLTKKNGENYTYKNNIYWQIIIDYKNIYGRNSYLKISYSLEKYNSRNIMYQSRSIGDGVSNAPWEKIDLKETRNFTILFVNDTLGVYENNNKDLIKEISGVNSISRIYIGAGPASYLKVTDTHVHRKTVYGRALPYLAKAVELEEAEDYIAAADVINEALKKNLKCFDTYFVRGKIYCELEFYASAIEDLTNALYYPSDSDERENAYFYRGLAKYQIKDFEGCMSDMKLAGETGRVFLNEFLYPAIKQAAAKKRSQSGTNVKRTEPAKEKPKGKLSEEDFSKFKQENRRPQR